jgi:CheY-like chemotaxis protein
MNPASESETTRILVADDDGIIQMVVKSMLEGVGYEVAVANNGREAIAELEGGRFDLVLLDCLMPEMDGFETCRFIRGSESASMDPRIPLIALSGLTENDELARCFSAGMDAFVAKPVDKQALLTAIGQCLDKPSTAGLSAGHDAAAEVAVGEEIIEKFMAEIPQVVAALKCAITDQDFHELRHLGHRLRGSAAVLKLARITAHSRALEHAAESSDHGLAASIAGTLQKELNRLLDDQ